MDEENNDDDVVVLTNSSSTTTNNNTSSAAVVDQLHDHHGGHQQNNNAPQYQKVVKSKPQLLSNTKALQQSDSDTESEGSVEWTPGDQPHECARNGADSRQLLVPSTSAVVDQPSSARKGITRDVRHKLTDVHVGVHESTSLLVDVPIHDNSDADDDIPLSWQSSNRAMREQLIKDGYNLDLESDNEDLDLIPPKQNYGSGGICSCSSDSCTIS